MGDNPRRGVHARTGFHYKCRNSGALDVNADNGPGTEKSLIDGIVGEVQKLGFRTIWQAAGHFDHIHIDVANSGPIGIGGGDGGAVGALEETGLDVKLIDWDAEYTPFTAASAGSPPAAPTAGRRAWRSRAIICDVLDSTRRRRPKVRLSAFEAAIVESGVHNLTYGDRDSLGVFQQRPSQDLGHGGADHGPRARGRHLHPHGDHPTRPVAARAPAQLAQDVQSSGFPDRYDQVRVQALRADGGRLRGRG